MSDEDIKIVTIQPEALQKVDKENNYVIRYRVSNEDGSKKSSWFPYTLVPAKQIPGTLPIPSTSMGLSVSGDIVSLQWTANEQSYRPLYDVFIKWSTDDGTSYSSYEFLDTVNIPVVTALKPNAIVDRAIFKVQVAGLVQEENTNLLLGESSSFVIT